MAESKDMELHTKMFNESMIATIRLPNSRVFVIWEQCSQDNLFCELDAQRSTLKAKLARFMESGYALTSNGYEEWEQSCLAST